MPIRLAKKELIALGAYVFAGGFTWGVKAAGFKVLSHLEETNYGVSTARKNFPSLAVHVGLKNWPLDELKAGPRIDLIYGNPPCAAWSVAGSKLKTSPKRNWKVDPRVECTRKHFSLLEKLRPRVWVWESVTQVFTSGRKFVDELTTRAADLGYSVTYLLHNAQYLGVPQTRKRFFFVAHESPFDVKDPSWDWQSCENSLAEVRNSEGSLSKDSKWFSRYAEMLHTVQPGETLVKAWDRWMEGKECKLTPRGFRKGRPAFTIRRLKASLPSSTVMCALIHPTEDRFLSSREQAHLCGFPSNYEFIGLTDVGQISRGVCPPVGKWLAENVARCFKGKRIINPLSVQLINLIDPPGKRERLQIPENSPLEDVPLPSLIRRPPKKTPKRQKRSLGSGEYIRSLLSLGKMTDNEIIIANRKQFPDSRATVKDVRWNALKLKRKASDTPLSQPTARKTLPQSIDPTREFDLTSLTEQSTPARVVHRDYGAHFFRWGFAGKFVNSSKEVLDVGCGQDTPLIKILNHPRSIVPKRYVGLDLRSRPKKVPQRKWATIHWEFDFTQRYQELGKFDLIVCFEVIEHMRRAAGEKLLTGLRNCVKSEGTILMSTPVFNGKAAANHLHEWTVKELEGAILAAGLQVKKRYGTFASYPVIKKVLPSEELSLLNRLREYYSNEVMACFLAPLYPDASRNNTWVLKRIAKIKKPLRVSSGG